MPAQFKIAITKEIIAHCKNCGTGNEAHRIENNCAIAFALADIFPKVHVTNLCIFPFGIDGDKENDIKIPMPLIAQQFIKLFDGFRLPPGCGYCFLNLNLQLTFLMKSLSKSISMM